MRVNVYKSSYDAAILLGILAYVGVFLGVSHWVLPFPHTPSTGVLWSRATGSLAFVMLHLVLAIGPLARLDPRFHLLLTNRRHLGVATFLVALTHAVLVTRVYHSSGVTNPLISLLTQNTTFTSLAAFPADLPGLAALLILAVLAITSHDAWNRRLGARNWKWVHMSAYVAYLLAMAHVVLGPLQAERALAYPLLVFAGAASLVGLHAWIGTRERLRDWNGKNVPSETMWIEGGPPRSVPQGGTVMDLKNKERVVLFRVGNRVSATTNVCPHQGGPLGEGVVHGDCVTCPWHGRRFHVVSGKAMSPDTSDLVTHDVSYDNGRVWVRGKPIAPDATALYITLPAERGAAPADTSGGGGAGGGAGVGDGAILATDVAASAAGPDSCPASPHFIPGPPMSPALRLRTQVGLAGLFILIVFVAAVLAANQRDPGAGMWDPAGETTITGRLYEFPYPTLVIPREDDPRRPTETILLAGMGKRGVGTRMAGLDGRVVALRGRILARDGVRLLELPDDSDAVRLSPETPAPRPEQQFHNYIRVAGEIVDPKCYLGALKPGDGKSHKSCAMLAIRGGLPPVFVTWYQAHHVPLLYMLADVNGQPLDDRILPYVADPVLAPGIVERRGDLYILRIDVAQIERRSSTWLAFLFK